MAVGIMSFAVTIDEDACCVGMFTLIVVYPSELLLQ